MKTNRLISLVLSALLVFPVASSAQKWLKEAGKVVGVVAGAAALNALTKNSEDNDENNEQAADGEEVTTSSRPERVTGMKIVTNHPDLKIKVKRCEVSGKTCVIDFIMTNYGNDADMTMFGSRGHSGSTAFDDEANEYRFAVQCTNSNLDNRQVSGISLLTDVPIKCRIQIEGVAPSATVFKRIHLIVDSREFNLNENKPIKFYNIPITREGDE